MWQRGPTSLWTTCPPPLVQWRCSLAPTDAADRPPPTARATASGIPAGSTPHDPRHLRRETEGRRSNDLCNHRGMHGHQAQELRRAMFRRLHLRVAARCASIPDECVDCGACESVCPVDAIYFDADRPVNLTDAVDLNRSFLDALTGRTDPLGSPGGAWHVGPLGVDTRAVAARPLRAQE